ncbi:hypothetical protein PXK00_00060 [Phaeobacter sp. QD34_3]|uniref:calcium-binding protein n=1 Tax=unclassified Phaeobacter TaxID=2621772 RepID=UPI00237F7BD3|nr:MULTISPECIES: hypothetical protein [unclassified Phaeobacter]MDE4131486.1 hypothetical protein [Phaeobacter sp. QD34_3]MDE4135425.1 hypothetical protein [Phaeobacter sp. QD34_24]
MYSMSESGDWTNEFNYTQTNVAEIQPGHTVSGTVGGSDAGDLIRVSLAYGQPYTFTLQGEGVSFVMLDDGVADPDADIDGNTMTFTAEHPSDFYNIRVTGNGSYTVAMEGLPADYLDDEDDGELSGAPTLADDSTITGVINGSGREGETDYYAFYAFGGMDYSFSMAQTDSPYGATSGGYLQILDEDGEPVSGVSGGSSAWDGADISFAPSLTGTYYLAAQTYFSFYGAYTIESYSSAAPTDQASLASITASEASGATTVTLRVTVENARESDVTGTVSVNAVDADYSQAVNSYEAGFTLSAGQTYVDVVVPVGTSSLYTEDTIFVGSIAAIQGLGIDQGFLASDTFVSDTNTDPTNGDDILIGTNGRDRILGLGGDDEISGLKQRDVLKGGAGQDTLNGGSGNDKLFGGSGGDVLNGQKGNDLLIGGGGADTFVFSGAFGNDRIRDFNANSNREDIDLSGIEEITGMRDLRRNHMREDGDDVIIEDGNGNSITLLDVDISDLGSGDFIF